MTGAHTTVAREKSLEVQRAGLICLLNFFLVFRPTDNAQLEALVNKTVISLISGKTPKWLNHT